MGSSGINAGVHGECCPVLTTHLNTHHACLPHSVPGCSRLRRGGSLHHRTGVDWPHCWWCYHWCHLSRCWNCSWLPLHCCPPSLYYGKREAEPEPEPYTIGQVLTGQTNGGAITHVDYGHGLPKVAGFPYTAVHTVAPVVHHGVVGYSHPVVYGKREAEAEPFYGYAAGVVPYVHHAAVVAPTGLGHAVAVTGYGHVTHSSNVGVCTNVAGVQVPC